MKRLIVLPGIFMIACLSIALQGCSLSIEESMTRGFELYDKGWHVEAQPYLEKAFEGGLDDPELVVRVAFLRATVSEDPSSAIEILMDSALRYPDYARTFNQLGFIAYNFGPRVDGKNLRQAVGFTLKATALDSSDWRIKDNLGLYYGMLGILDSSLYWLHAAKEIESDFPDLNARLAQLESFLAHKAMLDSMEILDTLEFEF